MKVLLALVMVTAHVWAAQAQSASVTPDLSKIGNRSIWDLQNREAEFNTDGKYAHVNAREGDGIVWLKDYTFGNGRIEVDLKGKNDRGRSFVGIAFHGVDEETYDVVYFRPFNFKDQQRKDFSVQYVSHPKYTWRNLRENFPNKYENAITPVPEPVDDWFHVVIEVDYPKVSVFINNERTSTIDIQQLSAQKKGRIGLWVGNNSEGDFKNLKIASAAK